MTQNLWLVNSEAVSYSVPGEELPQQEILQADGIPQLTKACLGG